MKVVDSNMVQKKLLVRGCRWMLITCQQSRCNVPYNPGPILKELLSEHNFKISPDKKKLLDEDPDQACIKFFHDLIFSLSNNNDLDFEPA